MYRSRAATRGAKTRRSSSRALRLMRKPTALWRSSSRWRAGSKIRQLLIDRASGRCGSRAPMAITIISHACANGRRAAGSATRRRPPMTALPEIPREVLDRQREASDPSGSAWVSANAGSGKTYVLAQRVIRLLLQGTPPAKILCITFTKAAAANMAASVFDRLAQWTALDNDALDDAVRRMTSRRPQPHERLAARRLFAQ